MRAAKSSEAKGESPARLEEFIDAAARALDLPVEAAWRPAIKTNLEVTLRLAAPLAEFPLPDDAEPAPVFPRYVEPPEKPAE